MMMLALVLGGCSRRGGFYVLPEHKDLGVVKGNTRVAVAEFEVVNGLDEPVRVKQIFPSCSCTTVKLRDNPIPPGRSTILRAEANLSRQAGKQEFTVVFTTDCSEFPNKRVSFEVMVPATGTRQRRLSIGSFYPGAKIDLALPASSFTQGSVDQVEQAGGDGGAIATRLAEEGGVRVLVVNGVVPSVVGAFSKKVRFRESIPGSPSLGEGTIELELAGTVVPRWVVKPDVYAGFVSLKKSDGVVSLRIDRDFASTDERKQVANVSATFDEEWVSLKSQSTYADTIELELKIDEKKLGHLGAVRSAMELRIHYADGGDESYATNLFMHVSP